MKYITILVFCFFYWGMCVLGIGGDRKNLLGLRSYPEDVQRIVRQCPELSPYLPKEKSLPAILLSNLLLFIVVFPVLVWSSKPCLDSPATARPSSIFSRWAKDSAFLTLS